MERSKTEMLKEQESMKKVYRLWAKAGPVWKGVGNVRKYRGRGRGIC